MYCTVFTVLQKALGHWINKIHRNLISRRGPILYIPFTAFTIRVLLALLPDLQGYVNSTMSAVLSFIPQGHAAQLGNPKDPDYRQEIDIEESAVIFSPRKNAVADPTFVRLFGCASYRRHLLLLLMHAVAGPKR